MSLHPLERSIESRMRDLRREAGHHALVVQARGTATARLARFLRTLADRFDPQVPADGFGPWAEDVRRAARA